MTFTVIEGQEPLLAELIALAFESAGHRCLVFNDIGHATDVLHFTRVDAIVVDIDMPGWKGIEWLETMVATWPDLPSRTLLLARRQLTRHEATRIRKLGAEVALRPSSLLGVELVVKERLNKTGSPPGRSVRVETRPIPAEPLN